MKTFQFIVIILLLLILGSLVYLYMQSNKADLVADDGKSVPKIIVRSNAFREINQKESRYNRDSVFRIDTFKVRYYYQTDADLWIHLKTGRWFYAQSVSPDNLPGVLEILNTGNSFFDTRSKQLILDNSSK